MKDYLNSDNSDVSDEHYGEDGDLEIDLDYNEYISVTLEEEDEPLDLSMKTVSRKHNQENQIQKLSLPTLDIRPNFNFSELDNNHEILVPQDNKGAVISEKEVTKLLDPYVKCIYKKFSCTVCDIKFASKVKALTHVENKHVDCLQYKCPLCRTCKGTRLAYESHLRRGHGAKVKDYCPLIRIKKTFCVKSEAQSSKTDTQTVLPYDLEFVTFLRHMLSSGDKMDRSSNILNSVEWIDQHQGMFRINNREQFAMGWCSFKGLDHVSWDYLYTTVIAEFINKNIFKRLSGDDLVFQVFCIKQLLK